MRRLAKQQLPHRMHLRISVRHGSLYSHSSSIFLAVQREHGEPFAPLHMFFFSQYQCFVLCVTCDNICLVSLSPLFLYGDGIATACMVTSVALLPLSVQFPFGKSTTAQALANALALAQSEAARSSASAGGVPQVPGAKAPAGAVISATLQYHRFSEEGLTATGFEPQRQTVIVEGRPVQVACNPIA